MLTKRRQISATSPRRTTRPTLPIRSRPRVCASYPTWKGGAYKTISGTRHGLAARSRCRCYLHSLEPLPDGGHRGGERGGADHFQDPSGRGCAAGGESGLWVVGDPSNALISGKALRRRRSITVTWCLPAPTNTLQAATLSAAMVVSSRLPSTVSCEVTTLHNAARPRLYRSGWSRHFHVFGSVERVLVTGSVFGLHDRSVFPYPHSVPTAEDPRRVQILVEKRDFEAESTDVLQGNATTHTVVDRIAEYRSRRFRTVAPLELDVLARISEGSNCGTTCAHPDRWSAGGPVTESRCPLERGVMMFLENVVCDCVAVLVCPVVAMGGDTRGH